MNYAKILVPLDGSANSKAALNEAITLAKQFGSEIYLLAVVDSVRHGVTTNYGSPSVDNMMKPLQDYSQKNLDAAAETVKNAGIKSQSLMIEADPKYTIAKDVPEQYDINLIVMGKSGADALQRLMVGSTTAYVVRHTESNVLVISSEDE